MTCRGLERVLGRRRREKSSGGRLTRRTGRGWRTRRSSNASKAPAARRAGGLGKEEGRWREGRLMGTVVVGWEMGRLHLLLIL